MKELKLKFQWCHTIPDRDLALHWHPWNEFDVFVPNLIIDCIVSKLSIKLFQNSCILVHVSLKLVLLSFYLSPDNWYRSFGEVSKACVSFLSNQTQKLKVCQVSLVVIACNFLYLVLKGHPVTHFVLFCFFLLES